MKKRVPPVCSCLPNFPKSSGGLEPEVSMAVGCSSRVIDRIRCKTGEKELHNLLDTELCDSPGKRSDPEILFTIDEKRVDRVFGQTVLMRIPDDAIRRNVVLRNLKETRASGGPEVSFPVIDEREKRIIPACPDQAGPVPAIDRSGPD